MSEVKERLRSLVRDHTNYKRWEVRFGNSLKLKRGGKEQQKVANNYDLSKEYRNQVTVWMDQCHEVKKKVEKEIRSVVHRLPIWTEWAEGQIGIGEITIGYLEAYVDLEHATDNQGRVTISKVHRFCGYGDPNDRHGERGKKRNYVETLKTQLYTAALSLEKSRNTTGHKYGEIYDGTKHRLQNSDRLVEHTEKGGKKAEKAWSEVSDGHRRDAALRKMTKEFLKDYVLVRASLEGRIVRPPYEEEFLERRHSA